MAELTYTTPTRCSHPGRYEPVACGTFPLVVFRLQGPLLRRRLEGLPKGGRSSRACTGGVESRSLLEPSTRPRPPASFSSRWCSPSASGAGRLW